MSFINQMMETRDKLLAAIEESKQGALRSIEDTQARLEKQRKEINEEFAELTDIVHDAYGKPEDKPEVVETIVT